MNNARKLTLLERAIMRAQNAYATVPHDRSIADEIADLQAWRNDLNSSPDQREE